MDNIKSYWDERARLEKGSERVTTNDVYLRKLEAECVLAELRELTRKTPVKILDVGCGDGQTTLSLAQHFPKFEFSAMDFSAEMIALAVAELRSRESIQNARFFVGDVRNLDDAIGNEKFSAIITNRCLINLPNVGDQYHALKEISRHLVPSGVFLGTENFIGGNRNLNDIRKLMNLPEISVRWHNLYFEEDEFLATAGQTFSSVELVNFSSAYYYITRVVYSAYCQNIGHGPDYEHPIHEVAMRMPQMGDYSPIKLIRARM